MPRVQAALNKAPAILVHERTAPCGLVAPTSACCRRSVDDQAALWHSEALGRQLRKLKQETHDADGRGALPPHRLAEEQAQRRKVSSALRRRPPGTARRQLRAWR